VVRRLYTPELANRSLALVRRIATDVQAVARRIQAHAGKLRAARAGAGDSTDTDDLDDLHDRFTALVGELEALGVELKDPLTGLLDFRARRQGQEVYLCWRLGEDAVGHWHTLDGGFAGRRPIREF
jgi:hypothetical protein